MGIEHKPTMRQMAQMSSLHNGVNLSNVQVLIKRKTWKGKIITKHVNKKERERQPTWLLSVDIAGVDRSQ